MKAYKRILAVGDIHGHYNKLKDMWQKLKFNKDNDFLIFLGDYIDRGPDNIAVIKFVMELNKLENVICLRGNHEEMFIDDIKNGFYFADKPHSALNELHKDKSLLKLFYDFANSRPYYHESRIIDKTYVFCHAGIENNIPMAEQSPHYLLWERESFLNGYNDSKYVVVGHTPVQCVNGLNTPLELSNKIIMCDTGSYLTDGKISCIDILSGKFWQG